MFIYNVNTAYKPVHRINRYTKCLYFIDFLALICYIRNISNDIRQKAWPTFPLRGSFLFLISEYFYHFSGCSFCRCRKLSALNLALGYTCHTFTNFCHFRAASFKSLNYRKHRGNCEWYVHFMNRSYHFSQYLQPCLYPLFAEFYLQPHIYLRIRAIP